MVTIAVLTNSKGEMGTIVEAPFLTASTFSQSLEECLPWTLLGFYILLDLIGESVCNVTFKLSRLPVTEFGHLRPNIFPFFAIFAFDIPLGLIGESFQRLLVMEFDQHLLSNTKCHPFSSCFDV